MDDGIQGHGGPPEGKGTVEQRRGKRHLRAGPDNIGGGRGRHRKIQAVPGADPKLGRAGVLFLCGQLPVLRRGHLLPALGRSAEELSGDKGGRPHGGQDIPDPQNAGDHRPGSQGVVPDHRRGGGGAHAGERADQVAGRQAQTAEIIRPGAGYLQLGGGPGAVAADNRGPALGRWGLVGAAELRGPQYRRQAHSAVPSLPAHRGQARIRRQGIPQPDDPQGAEPGGEPGTGEDPAGYPRDAAGTGAVDPEKIPGQPLLRGRGGQISDRTGSGSREGRPVAGGPILPRSTFRTPFRG